MSKRTTSATTRRLNMEIIGANIRRERLARGYTATEMSETFGAMESYFRQIETGHKNVSIHRLIEIADMFGIPAAKLLEGI